MAHLTGVARGGMESHERPERRTLGLSYADLFFRKKHVDLLHAVSSHHPLIISFISIPVEHVKLLLATSCTSHGQGPPTRCWPWLLLWAWLLHLGEMVFTDFTGQTTWHKKNTSQNPQRLFVRSQTRGIPKWPRETKAQRLRQAFRFPQNLGTKSLVRALLQGSSPPSPSCVHASSLSKVLATSVPYLSR